MAFCRSAHSVIPKLFVYILSFTDTLFAPQNYPLDGQNRNGYEPLVEIKTEDDEELLNRALDSVSYNDNDSMDTPNKPKKSIHEPRTPTPFKNALNEFRKRRGET